MPEWLIVLLVAFFAANAGFWVGRLYETWKKDKIIKELKGTLLLQRIQISVLRNEDR